MTAIRLGLITVGLLLLAGNATAQNQLEWLATEEIQSPADTLIDHHHRQIAPMIASPLEQQPFDGGHIEHAPPAEAHVGDTHFHDYDGQVIGDPILTEPDPMGMHVGDGWGMQDVHAESNASCATCECGEEKCHGVCTDPGWPRKPKWDKPGDRNRGDCPPYRYRIPDCQRAGNPHCVAKWAKCSVNKKYSAWFVGGGAAFFRGRCRKPSEGTWGLDYDGFFGRANNWLTYTRGRKQGGEGAYETDGEPEFVSKAHHLLGLGH